MTHRTFKDNLEAIMLIEGDESATHDEQIDAWQYLVDTGIVWSLQGFYGRSAQAMIEAGILHPAEARGHKPITKT